MFSACVQQSLRGPAVRAAAAFLVLLAAGCKSGASWNAKPSWWSLGSDDPAKAVSAPATDVVKPSATSKQYPTTSTPEGYVIEGSQKEGAAQTVAATAVQPPPATPPAAITYGSKPVEPPAFASTPAASAAPPAAAGLSSISPQVGPYAAPPAAAPVPDQPLPSTGDAFASAPRQEPFAAATAPPAATDSPFGAGGARVADARAGEAWAAPAAVPPATPSTESRYAAGGGSRFASPGAPPEQPAALQFSPPPAAPSAVEAAPAALPAAMPAPAAAPPSMTPAVPAATPPAVPVRRPDSGYRPAGTSNYRPGSRILAGAEEPPQAGVVPASFQAPASP